MGYLPNLILPAALAAVLGYLLGSISFSIIITKGFTKTDIRSYGSGNAGATNVLRSVGKLPAALTFVFDFLKCCVSVVLGYIIFRAACENIAAPEHLTIIGKYAAGMGCMLGHIFPIYFSFKGGKGVVTTAALIALLDWRVFIPVLLTFIAVFAVKRIVSLSSIIAAAMFPIYSFIIMYLFDYTGSPISSGGSMGLVYIFLVTAMAAIIGGIVITVHRPNIQRLRRGEEKPLSIGGRPSRG